MGNQIADSLIFSENNFFQVASGGFIIVVIYKVFKS